MDDQRFPIIGTTEQLIEMLASPSDDVRKSAVTSLITAADDHAAEILSGVAHLLIRASSIETQAACIDIARHFNCHIELSEIRKDGWMDTLKSDADNFTLVAGIIGERYLAYAILLGIQITRLARDPVTPANTTVHFTIDANADQVLPLAQFRVQVAAAMLSIPRNHHWQASPPLDESKAAALIGDFTLMLAPVFNLSLATVLVVPRTDAVDAIVGFTDAVGFSWMPLQELSDMICESIAGDIQSDSPQQHRLDLSVVDTAMAAADAEDSHRVITLLEAWPGLLSTMIRTPEVQQLSDAQLERIATGLRLLGDAWDRRGDTRWAEELYRLGIQYVRELPMAGPLYLTMGLLMTRLERWGEAIGYLRRAQALGMSEREVYPALGRSLLKTGKTIGAYLILKEAQTRSGMLPEELREMLKCAEERICSAKLSWPCTERADSTPRPDP